MFEGKEKNGLEVIQKATREWNEFELANKDRYGMSSRETKAEELHFAKETPMRRGITITIGVKIKKSSNKLGG